MTPLFIEEFKSKNKCPYCSKEADQKSLCRQHLEVARLTWKIWRINRRKDGLCSYCNTPSVTRSPRCETHREIQRGYQAAFCSRNPGYIQQATKDFAARKAALIPQGLCNCRARNPLEEGKRWCKDCLKKMSLRVRLNYHRQANHPKEVSYYTKQLDRHRQTIYNRYTKKLLSGLKATRQKLRELGYKTDPTSRYAVKAI